MSWWWLAPLVVAGGGSVMLRVLARRLAQETVLAARSAERLAATMARLVEARPRLVVDVGRYRPTETRPAPR